MGGACISGRNVKVICFKLRYQLFGRTSDIPVIYEKAKSVCFIYMQTQKVKFKFVQINMNQVSYYFTFKRLSIANFRLNG